MISTPMDFSITTLEDRIVIDYTGQYDRKDALKSIKTVVDACTTNSITRVLIDFRNIHGDVSVFERYKMAECLSKQNHIGIRFAAIARNDQTKPTKIGEAVAKSRGVDLKITTDPDEALESLYLKSA